MKKLKNKKFGELDVFIVCMESLKFIPKTGITLPENAKRVSLLNKFNLAITDEDDSIEIEEEDFNFILQKVSIIPITQVDGDAAKLWEYLIPIQ